MAGFLHDLNKLFLKYPGEKIEKKGNLKLSVLPEAPSLLSPDFKEKRAHADAKFSAFEKGFELAEKKSEKD